MTWYVVGNMNILTISTHTPLTGRDLVQEMYCMAYNISTHTPLTGRDCNVANASHKP